MDQELLGNREVVFRWCIRKCVNNYCCLWIVVVLFRGILNWFWGIMQVVGIRLRLKTFWIAGIIVIIIIRIFGLIRRYFLVSKLFYAHFRLSTVWWSLSFYWVIGLYVSVLRICCWVTPGHMRMCLVIGLIDVIIEWLEGYKDLIWLFIFLFWGFVVILFGIEVSFILSVLEVCAS